MPIRAVKDIEARRAAKAAAEKAETAPAPLIDPPKRVRMVANPPKRRGHATKDDNGKWQPTGEYEAGWCRPPDGSKFKKGGKPGPGRPVGSVSHDAILRRLLAQRRRVRVEGREKNLPLREIIIANAVMAGLKGSDRDARKYLLEQSARLYPDSVRSGPDAQTGTDLSPSDALSIAEFEADLRERLRAELEAERNGTYMPTDQPGDDA